MQGGALRLGDPDKVLFWSEAEKLAGLPRYDRLFPTRVVRTGREPLELPRRARDLGRLRYEVAGETFDLEDFVRHNRVTGLLVIERGAIALERYALGHRPDARWNSFSVTKSVVSMLVGAAIHDGHLGGVDDLVADYLPEMRGTSYDGVRIRDVLRMASGVDWNEDYADPESDVANGTARTSLERLRYLASRPRIAPPGERFNYSTGETHLLGAVLRAALGTDLSSFLESKIWQSFGMEADAHWMLVEPGGAEHGGCCLSAVLRDWGRIGLFALRDGVLPDGTRVLPPGWMAESTTPSPANEEYGYLWWLRGRGAFRASGIFGQMIHVDPAAQVVVVTQGVWPAATDEVLGAHRDAFLAAVSQALASPGAARAG
ncbi:MAG TPA: serine hydrolase [Longimicrobiales bacterium]|nr:serine hydrolase [Longimicrobiales bacterium]